MYSRGSGISIDIHFVDLEVSYDVLSPLPIVLSKHFNHPHPYIEIATAISDYWKYYRTFRLYMSIICKLHVLDGLFVMQEESMHYLMEGVILIIFCRKQR